MAAILPELAQVSHIRHRLHGADRHWPETNCHTDLWIELLAALGREPSALTGMTVALDWEGDQFTFFKIHHRDFDELAGITIEELSIYRPLADHIDEQIARGRFVVVDVDAFHLPDTAGLTYRTGHSKTAIAVNRLDRAEPTLGYFHGPGYFEARGEDAVNLMALDPADPPLLPPYAEFAKADRTGPDRRDLGHLALRAFMRHLKSRPTANPIRAFRSVIARDLDTIAPSETARFHGYAFQTARMLGAAHELLGDHLAFLGTAGADTGAPEALAARIAGEAKTLQFLMARALARRRFEPVEAALDTLADHHDALSEALARAFGPPGRAPRADRATLAAV